MTTTALGRIAYIAPRYSPHTGGVQTHVAQLARRAAAHGYQVEVLTQDSDRRLPAVEVIDGATVRRFPVWVPGQTYTVAPGLWAYLARYYTRYDVVHAHGYHAVPALGAALAGCQPLYWMVTAHTYAAHDIGLAAALISTMTLASILSSQGIGWTLIQLLPGCPAGRAWSLTLTASLTTGLLTGLCAAAIVVVALPLFAP